MIADGTPHRLPSIPVSSWTRLHPCSDLNDCIHSGLLAMNVIAVFLNIFSIASSSPVSIPAISGIWLTPQFSRPLRMQHISSHYWMRKFLSYYSTMSLFWYLPLPRVHSILLSNFMINLRSVYQSTGNLSDPVQQSLSMQFASSVLGNIGAPLNSSWALNMDDSEQDSLDRIERSRWALFK